jgi:hypothetical protein
MLGDFPSIIDLINFFFFLKKKKLKSLISMIQTRGV